MGCYYMSQGIGADLVLPLISGGSVGGPLQRLVPRADDSRQSGQRGHLVLGPAVLA